MQFGCAVSVEDYKYIGATDFDYAELPCRKIVSLSLDEFNDLEKTMNGNRPILALNLYCPPEIIIAGPAFDLTKARQYAVAAAERASILGVKKIGIGSPMSRTLPEGFPEDKAMNQLIGFLTETADIFQRKGIHVCLEALGHVYCNFVNKLDEAMDVIHSIGHPNLHVVLDFYNMEFEEEADRPLEFVTPNIDHAHLSDDLNGDPRKRSYLLPEKENVHRQRIQRLASSGYDDTLSLEIDVSLSVCEANRSLQYMRAGYDDYISMRNN